MFTWSGMRPVNIRPGARYGDNSPRSGPGQYMCGLRSCRLQSAEWPAPCGDQARAVLDTPCARYPVRSQGRRPLGARENRA